TSLDFAVHQLLQLERAEGFAFPRLRTNVVAGSIRPLKRFEKVLRLFCIRLQFHFRRQFHEENCSMFVRIRQIFERRLKPMACFASTASSTAAKAAWLPRPKGLFL